MSASLQGRVALVTGASRGLGAAIAVKLGECGASVVVNYYKSREKAQAVASRIEQAGGHAATLEADVRDEEQVKSLVAKTRTLFGPVDILVPNASGPQPFLSIERQSWQAYLDQLEFFVKSPLLLVRETVAEMKQRRSGRIIQIGSEVFELGNPEFANYVAAKGAQLGMTRSWARELAPFGITVNLVAPGWIPTERHAGTKPEDLAAYAAQVPMRRQGTAEDVAEAVAYLASDAAGFITGQKLSVNGGHTLE
ncbi:MAG: SDR family oxidoreductase [Acidimicrobiia bacterium]|nr:SDR family oxidoreductase [Acidimicrobiia bacterium]